jgi:GNAT superfamily N-acetyltransferase
VNSDIVCIRELNFEQVLPVWRDHLWPQRDSEIKPVSSVTPNFDIDMKIYEFSDTVRFWGLFYGETIVAANSCFKSKQDECRSRGLWVHEDWRRRRLSQVLLQLVYQYAIENECTRVWSLPRQSALPAYECFGFQKVSPWTNRGMAYGPNCLAELRVGP